MNKTTKYWPSRWNFFMALVLLVTTNGLKAQIIPASLPPNLVTTGIKVDVLNSALFAYYMGGPTMGDVAGVAWDDGSGNAYFVIGDIPYGGGAAWLPIVTLVPPPGYVSVSKPDIAIGGMGNATGFSSYNWIGVSYIATNATGHSNLFMDVYFIHSPATGMFGVPYGPPTIAVPITSSGAVVANDAAPHIDVITGVNSSGPMPGTCFSEQYALCWEEGIKNSTTCVRGMSDWFRDTWDYPLNPTLPMSTWSPAICNAAGMSFKEPDIAGIQRDNTSTTGTIDRMGFFTYVDANDNLYYQEWNIAYNTLAPALPLDVNSRMPRIDAVDPYTLNNPLVPMAHYDITYFNYTLPGVQVNSVNDASGPYSLISSSWAFPGYAGRWPAVAFGPGNTYTATYEASDGLDDVYAQRIDWPSGALFPGYYQVNNTGLNFTNTMPSVSQEANLTVTGGSQVFEVWYDFTTNTIWYKTTYDPLAFRQSAGTASAESKKWIISPNPAVNEITLSTRDKAPGDNYKITNMLGQVVVGDKIEGTNSVINTSNLAPGIYVMQIYNTGTLVQTIKFGKQ